MKTGLTIYGVWQTITLLLTNTKPEMLGTMSHFSHQTQTGRILHLPVSKRLCHGALEGGRTLGSRGKMSKIMRRMLSNETMLT